MTLAQVVSLITVENAQHEAPAPAHQGASSLDELAALAAMPVA